MTYLINAPEKAERVRTFIESLEHVKGVWDGKPFKLIEEWQWNKVVLPLFGTVKDDGYRQYRIVYVEIAKKNGKTPLGAAVGLYMLCGDGEAGPEVYCVATDREQASYAYYYASEMARREPHMNKYLEIFDGKRRIVNHHNNGILQVLASEDAHLHGLNPSCVIFDEMHAQKTDSLWRTLTSGTHYARTQQLIFVMTTAGIFDKESIWWKTREKARQIRDGIIKNPSFLPVLYIADPEKDDPADREVWKRVNPSLGHIFDMEKMEEEFTDAKNDPVAYQDFLRFRLNIPIRQLIKWMPMSAWDKCGGVINEKELQGKPCYGGLDLSSKIDLTAFVLVFPGDPPKVLCRFYVPEDTIMKRSKEDAVHYEIWAEQGYITATPGNVIDTQFIENDILEASRKYNLVEIGYDPWKADDLVNRLYNDYGIPVVEMRQGSKTLSAPANDVLVAVMSGKLNHGNNPVLRWCADNLVMKIDANENVQPAKDKATDRIDGMVALIMAWGRSMFGEKESRYETEDLRVL